MIDGIKVFLSYSHKDKDLKDIFVTHLFSLIRTEENLTLWTDENIQGGHSWDQEINKQLLASDLILLLISPDFIQSDYCYNNELKQALQLHQQRKAVVVPVGLRSTDITGQPFSGLQMLPVDPLFVDSWGNRDEAFTNVIQGLRKTLTCIVAELKNWNPIVRKDEIRKLIENKKFEDACDKLFGFVCDFFNDETLKDKISMIKGEYCDIMDDKAKVDYLQVRQAIRKLLEEIFAIIEIVMQELKKAAA